jgi:hypothetical protein
VKKMCFIVRILELSCPLGAVPMQRFFFWGGGAQLGKFEAKRPSSRSSGGHMHPPPPYEGLFGKERAPKYQYLAPWVYQVMTAGRRGGNVGVERSCACGTVEGAILLS